MCIVPVQALMSLFVLASKDGWVNIMYSGLDAVGVDLQVRNTAYSALLLSNDMKTLFYYSCIEGHDCSCNSTLTVIFQY